MLTVERVGQATTDLREAIRAANTDAPVDACPAGSGADAITLTPGRTARPITFLKGESGHLAFREGNQ